MSEFKIVIHNPDKVDMNDDILVENSTIYETYKEFDNHKEAKKWLLEYTEIMQMIGCK